MSENVVRPPSRLVALNPSTPIALVVAPAGFGKSTVLHAWRETETVSNTLLKFGGLVAPDNTLDTGRALLRSAVNVDGDLAEARALADLLPPDGQSFGEDFLRGFSLMLKAIDQPFRIYLDEVERLSPNQQRELGTLVASVSSPVRRFVLASRDTPPWPVQRLRLEGALTLVTVDDLELTIAEVQEALGTEFGDRGDQIAALSAGWPAAVQVMRWHANESPPLFADRVVDDLAEYVRAEVLPLLPPQQSEVLTRLALLDPFPMSVGVAVSGDPETAQLLTETMNRTALVEIDEEGLVTIHSTMKSALLKTLRAREPEAERLLHLRAAEAWLALPQTAESFVRAVDHYLAGEYWEAAMGTIRHRWSIVEAISRLDRLVSWLDQIPSQLWRTDRDFGPMYVLANLRLGRPNQAHKMVKMIEADGDDVTVDIAHLAYAASVGWETSPEMALTICTDVQPRLLTQEEKPARPGFALFPGVNSYALAAEIARCQALAMAGQFADAVRAYRALIPKMEAASPVTQVVGWGTFGGALAMLGELDEAALWLDSADVLAEEQGCAYHLRTIPARLGRAAALALGGDRRAALVPLELAGTISRSSRCLNFLHMCDLAAVLCHVDEKYVDSVDPPLVVRPLAVAEQFRKASAARKASRHGRHVNAILRLRGVAPHELMAAHWTEVMMASRGRAAAASWLENLADPGSASGKVIRLLCAATTVPGAAEAADLAEEAADFATTRGLHGLIAEAPEQLWRRPSIADSRSPLLLAAIKRVEVDLDTDAVRLTEREHDLLRLLPLELRLADLAERLFVSVHTLKWHRANLYRKLGVKSRDAAVAEGLRLNLI